MIRDHCGHPGCPRTLEKVLKRSKLLWSVPESPRYFRSGVAPGKHRKATEITWKAPGPPGNILQSVCHDCMKPVDPRMLIKVIQDRPGLSRFTRVHHSSLGFDLVDRGVALRKHPGRPRLESGCSAGQKRCKCT